MIETHIICRGFSRTESITAQVERHVEKLEKFYDRISRCEVTISHRPHHQRQGQVFHVQVLLRLPHEDIVVNREPERDPAHEDFAVAVHDAFRAARRRLEDQVRMMRGFTKKHEAAETDISAG
jgi:ribosome-associated translation inhibitor RaiA